jgi:hypothetical protein
MDTIEADTGTLFSLLARHWTVGASIEQAEFDEGDEALAFVLADGRVVLTRTQDDEAPGNRLRVALDDGRVTISPRSRPVPPIVQIAIGHAPVPLARFGASGFVVGNSGHLARLSNKGELQRLGEADDGPPAALAALPGGGFVAATERGLLVHDGSGARRIEEVSSSLSSLAVSPDGRRIAIGSSDGLMIRPLEPGGGQARAFTVGTVSRLAWSPDGNWLAASVDQGGIVVVRPADGRTFPLPAYPASVRSLAWTMDSHHLATSGAYRIIVWKVESLAGNAGRPEVPETGRAGLNAVESLDMHPHRPLVAAGYGNGMVVIAAIGKRDELVVKEAGGTAIRALRWSRNGQHLALGTQGGQAAILTFPSHLFK